MSEENVLDVNGLLWRIRNGKTGKTTKMHRTYHGCIDSKHFLILLLYLFKKSKTKSTIILAYNLLY